VTSLGSVSVCMATYNGARFVQEQLASILDQLGPEDEIVVVDDASTDETVSVIRSLADPRIRVEQHPENFGYARAFESAITASVNDHIFLADQDDRWPDGRLAAMQAALGDHHLVVGGVARSDGTLARPGGTTRRFRLRDDRNPGRVRNILLLASSQLPYYSCAMGFSRELAGLALPFPESARELPDAWLGILGLTLRSTAHLELPVVLRREHDANATGRIRPWRQVLHGRRLFVRMLLDSRRRIRRGAPLTPPRGAARSASAVPADLKTDVACVVVHHDSLDTLKHTLSSLVVAGLAADALTVVDNSERSVATSDLEDTLPEGAGLIRVSNRGFAAAVNLGIQAVRAARRPYAVLVATHEVLVEADCVSRLLSDLVEDPRLGVVGPILSTPDGRVWSAGGRLSRLGVPSHRLHRPGLADVSESDWLDGALCLYRWEAVDSTGLDERYFLYFEELDFHLQLRAQGWHVAVDSRAHASQSTLGMPAFYAARNFRLLQRRLGHGPARRALAVTVWSTARLAGMVRTFDGRGMTDFAHGMVSSLPPPQ
jgi:GT2 family glycosyltransferase